jgi:CSLREA domain-containing protein
MKTAYITLPFIFVLAAVAVADTFTVTNTADPGDGVCNSACTLREAITAANANPGADTIAFNIPGSVLHTISPTSEMPTITETLTIDGYTQPGAAENSLAIGDNAVLLIELNGTNAGAGAIGLNILHDGNMIRGLVINRFSSAINIIGIGNVVQGNFIGTDAAGTGDVGNTFRGVSITIGDSNVVGGLLPGARNLISGNDGAGVTIFCCSDANNVIQGNYIGTDRNGTAVLPNEDGVFINSDARFNLVGGTEVGAANLISGNNLAGVHITGDGFSNTVQGNFIGTDATGTMPLPNTDQGVLIDAQTNNLVGGTETGAGNLISGNGDDGVLINNGATGNLVQGNFIGTDVTGSVALGNAGNGVHVDNAPTNTVGGLTAATRNIISGNTGSGVSLENAASTNTVQGNYLGTDVTGNIDLGNAQNGVLIVAAPNNVIGGTVDGARNVISGNSFGIQVAIVGADGNKIQGNFIGTDAAGVGPVGNEIGILLFKDSTGTTVGGPGGAGNIIAFSTANSGIAVNSASSGNLILRNSIFANEELGIDLQGGTEDANGVTANDFPDGDTGANNLQNYPTISGISVSGSDRTVEGELFSNPNTDYSLDFYSNSEVDPSGYGEGETWLGSLDVHTNNQSQVDFSFPLEPSALGRYITATATDPNGNTSEFSLASELVPPLSRFLNISTRLRVQTGDNVLIGGFIITGNDSKQVIVRAIGPSLGDFGVADPLANPILELHYPDGTTVVTNNNWREDQEVEIMATGLAPSDDLESAIVATLDPGTYTAIVRGVNGGTGVALVETYDLDQSVDSALANISTRGLVETGDNVMIGGIIVGPDQAAEGSILLRAIGPSLSNFGITNPLADPTLELRDGNGALIVSNDNWKSTQQTAIEATGLQPSDDLESAILATLAAGNYTAIMRGVGNTTGIGLVEAYHLD